MAELKPFFSQMRGSWTATAPLPGGEHMTTAQALLEQLLARHGWLPVDIAKRWANTYGNRVWQLLDGVTGPDDLGQAIGGGLFAREVDYLCEAEWATTADDILWRRTKLGLFTHAAERLALENYLQQTRVGLAQGNAA